MTANSASQPSAGINPNAIGLALGRQRTVTESSATTSESAMSVRSRRRLAETTNASKKNRSNAWKAKVEELSKRGMPLRNLLEFYAHLQAHMPHFDPQKSTTRDVVRGAVIPLSAHCVRICMKDDLRLISTDDLSPASNAFASLVNEDVGLPDCMVTHHWANLFAHTVAAVVADALRLPTFENIAAKLGTLAGVEEIQEKVENASTGGTVYWICAFSVDQHVSICDGFGAFPENDAVTSEIYSLCACGREKHFWGDLCEMNKFNEMMVNILAAKPAFRQIVAVDVDFEIFSRAWCIAEVVEAHKRGMGQSLVVFSTSFTAADRSKLSQLDVRDCHASRPEDKDTIMAEIPDVEEFNIVLRDLLLKGDSSLVGVWMRSALGSYFTAWDEFSEKFMEALEEASAGSSVHFWCIQFAAVVSPLTCVLVPYETADASWNKQSVYLNFCIPLQVFLCCGIFPAFMAPVLRLERNAEWAMKAFVWLLMEAALVCAVSNAIVSIWRVFPIPFHALLQAASSSMQLPLLWWCAPAERRRQHGYKWDMGYTLIGLIFIVYVFGLIFPMLNAAMDHVDTGWQALLLVLYLFGKLVFERLGTLLSKRLGSDSMPIYIFAGAYFYECNLCLVLAHGFSPVIFVELLSFDAIENLYHLSALYRNIGGQTGNPRSRKQYYIVAALIIRESIELSVPAQFAIQIVTAHWLQPKYNQLVCSLTHQELTRIMAYLVADIVVEAAIGVLTYVMLRKLGFAPLRMLRGLFSISFLPFLLVAAAVTTFSWGLQHSHNGVDLSFKLSWLHSQSAQWICGLSWTT